MKQKPQKAHPHRLHAREAGTPPNNYPPPRTNRPAMSPAGFDFSRCDAERTAALDLLEADYADSAWTEEDVADYNNRYQDIERDYRACTNDVVGLDDADEYPPEA